MRNDLGDRQPTDREMTKLHSLRKLPSVTLYIYIYIYTLYLSISLQLCLYVLACSKNALLLKNNISVGEVNLTPTQ